MKISNLLKSLDVREVPAALRHLFERIDDNFATLKGAFSNKISLLDNIECDIVDGVFDSGKEYSVRLKNLTVAKGAIVLSAAAPCISTPIVRTADGCAKITMYFAQMASGVRATLVLFPYGTGGNQANSLLATATTPGIAYPDGSTITVDSGGKLTAVPQSAGLVTLLDHDFTADPTTATFANDLEDKTIGGLSPFWAANSAVRNVFLNTNGIGIQIEDVWNGMRLRSPKISVLCPTIDFTKPYFVWIYTNNLAVNAVTNRCQQGMCWFEYEGGATEYSVRAGKVVEAGPITRYRTSYYGIASANCVTPDGSPMDLTDGSLINDNVTMIKVHAPLKVEFYSCAWAAGWPAYPLLRLRSSVDVSAMWTGQPRLPSIGTARVDFSSYNSPGAPSRCQTQIRRLRIDQ